MTRTNKSDIIKTVKEINTKQEGKETTFGEIAWMNEINEVCEEKVSKIAESIKINGWMGCPILVFNGQLLTGSHRLAALKKLDEDGEDIVGYFPELDQMADKYMNMLLEQR